MMKMQRLARQTVGFTLIELMIVIAIIGVLAAIAIPQYQRYATRAEVSNAFSAIRTFQLAMEEYAHINEGFPADPADLPGIAGDTAVLTCAGNVAQVDYTAVDGATTATLDVIFYANGAAVVADCNDGTNAATASIPQPLSGETIRFIADINTNNGKVRWGIEATGDNTTVAADYIPKFGAGFGS
jgi:prepilin-type N-terminal cleavage/methylation domain-containing protein